MLGAVAGVAAMVCAAAVLSVAYVLYQSIVDPIGWAETARGLFWIMAFGIGGTAVVAGVPSAAIGAVVGGVVGGRPVRWVTALAVVLVAAIVAAGLVVTVQRAVVEAERGLQPGRPAAAEAPFDPALARVPAAFGAGAGGVTGVVFLLLYERLRARPSRRELVG